MSIKKKDLKEQKKYCDCYLDCGSPVSNKCTTCGSETKYNEERSTIMKIIDADLIKKLSSSDELRGIDLSVKQIQKYRYSFNQLMEMSYNNISLPLYEDDLIYTFLCNDCEFYVIESMLSGSLEQLVFIRNK